MSGAEPPSTSDVGSDQFIRVGDSTPSTSRHRGRSADTAVSSGYKPPTREELRAQLLSAQEAMSREGSLAQSLIEKQSSEIQTLTQQLRSLKENETEYNDELLAAQEKDEKQQKLIAEQQKYLLAMQLQMEELLEKRGTEVTAGSADHEDVEMQSPQIPRFTLADPASPLPKQPTSFGTNVAQVAEAPSAPSAGPTASTPDAPAWFQQFLQTSAEMQKHAMEQSQAFMKHVAESEKRFESLMNAHSKEVRLTREAADRREAKREKQKIELAAPSLPKFPKLLGKRAQYKAVKEFCNSLTRSLGLAYGEPIEYTPPAADGSDPKSQRVKLGQGLGLEIEREALAQYDDAIAASGKSFRYDTEAELMNRKLALHDKTNFADVEAHLLQEFEEALEDEKLTLALYLGEPSQTESISNPFRTGAITIGYVVHRLYWKVHHPSEELFPFSTALLKFKIGSNEDLSGARELQLELTAFRELTEFALRIKAPLDARTLIKKLMGEFTELHKRKPAWFERPDANELKWLEFSSKLADLLESDSAVDDVLEILEKFDRQLSQLVVVPTPVKLVPVAKSLPAQPKAKAEPSRKADDSSKVAAPKAPPPQTNEVPPPPPPPPPPPTTATEEEKALPAKDTPKEPAPKRQFRPKRSETPKSAPTPEPITRGVCAFYKSANGCFKQDCPFLHRKEDHRDGACTKCNTTHDGDKCPGFRPRRLPSKSAGNGETSRVARAVISLATMLASVIPAVGAQAPPTVSVPVQAVAVSVAHDPDKFLSPRVFATSSLVGVPNSSSKDTAYVCSEETKGVCSDKTKGVFSKTENVVPESTPSSTIESEGNNDPNAEGFADEIAAKVYEEPPEVFKTSFSELWKKKHKKPSVWSNAGALSRDSDFLDEKSKKFNPQVSVSNKPKKHVKFAPDVKEKSRRAFVLKSKQGISAAGNSISAAGNSPSAAGNSHSAAGKSTWTFSKSLLGMVLVSIACLAGRMVGDMGSGADVGLTFPQLVRTAKMMDLSEQGWSLVDSGSRSVLIPELDAHAPDRLHRLSMNGLANRQTSCWRLGSGEVSVPGENLTILPQQPIIELASKSQFIDVGGSTCLNFSFPGRQITTRLYEGYQWVSPSDSDFIRRLLSEQFKSSYTTVQDVSVSDRLAEKDEEIMEEVAIALKAFPTRPDFWFLGRESPTLLRWLTVEPNLMNCLKPYKRSLGQIVLRRCFHKAKSPEDFIWRLYKYEKTVKVEEMEEDLRESSPLSVSFERCRLGTSVAEIPLSHRLTHFPLLPGCLSCTRGRTQRKPFITTELDTQKDFDESRIRVNADFVGKRLPVASKGECWALCFSSSLGHRMIVGLKSKTNGSVLGATQLFFNESEIPPGKSKLYMDKENTSEMSEWLVKEGGVYESGTANDKNSHGQSEVNIQICSGGLRSTMLEAGVPFKHWRNAANTWSVNYCRDRGLCCGKYRGPLLLFGECSWVRLPGEVYSPPVVSPKGTKVQFVGYGSSENTIKIEYFDQNVGKRRKTELNAQAFVDGFARFEKNNVSAEHRPLYGFKLVYDEKEQLETIFEDVLAGEAGVASRSRIPREKESGGEVGVSAGRKRLKEIAAQKKARETRRSKKAKIRADDSYVAYPDVSSLVPVDADMIPTDEEMAMLYHDISELDGESFYDACAVTAEAYDLLASGADLDDDQLSAGDAWLNLGVPEEEDQPEKTPLESSCGNESFVSFGKPSGKNMACRIAKTVTEKETKTTYSHLGWSYAWNRESNKHFEKFKTLSTTAQELFSLPKGSQLVRFFPLRTIKNFEQPVELHEANIRVAAGGNVVSILTEQGWIKLKSPVVSRFDTIDSASVETQRTFIIASRLLGWSIIQSDADGAYLQAPLNQEKRGGRLFAIVPKDLIPEGNPALQMRCPVFEVLQAAYGLEESGFLYDKFAVEQMEQAGWKQLVDIDQSVSVFTAGEPFLPTVDQEPIYEDLPPFTAMATRYVDDFLRSSPPGEDPPALGGLKLKPGSQVTKFIGQELSFDEESGDFIASQISYVVKAVKEFEETLQSLDLPPLKTYMYPASKELPHSEKPGVFADSCAKWVQTLAYVVRLTRCECLFAVGRLSRYLTKWTDQCDVELIHLFGYLKGTSGDVMRFMIDPRDLDEKCLELILVFDADHGGCVESKRSTSGAVLVLCGTHGTHAHIMSFSRRQTVAGCSTPECETVSCVAAYKRAVRLSMLLNALLRYSVPLRIYGDNSATEYILHGGGTSQLAYMKRTQGISLAGARRNIGPLLGRVPTDANASDLQTKPIVDKEKFYRFKEFLGIGRMENTV